METLPVASANVWLGLWYRRPMDNKPFSVSNRFMPRCVSCNTIVTKHDIVCYGCGDPVPKSQRPFQPKRISKVSNILFIASLGLTAFSFLSEHKMPLWLSIALSATLLIVRIIADRVADKDSDSSPYRMVKHADQPGFASASRLRNQPYRTRSG
jgi:hypothetical protein